MHRVGVLTLGVAYSPLAWKLGMRTHALQRIGAKAMQLAQWCMVIELVTMAMQINGIRAKLLKRRGVG